MLGGKTRPPCWRRPWLRHAPFFANYCPQVCFRTADVTGAVNLGDGVEMVMPGESPAPTSHAMRD